MGNDVDFGTENLVSVVREEHSGDAPSIMRKAFAILDTLRRSTAPISLSQISKRGGMPKSTVHRVIGLLLELGAVERSGADYRIGPAMFGYGIRSPHTAMREAAAPHVRALASATGQTVQLGMLSGREVLYLEKVCGGTALSPMSVGDRLGAHMTALGKAMLAFSDDDAVHTALDGRLARQTSATITDRGLLAAELIDVRNRHLAQDREEVLPGLRCIGVPVMIGRRAVAAVSIAYPAAGGSGHAFAGVLWEAAARIGRAATPVGLDAARCETVERGADVLGRLTSFSAR